MRVVTMIVIMIMVMFGEVSVVICWIVFAIPVLGLCVIYRIIREDEMIKVLIEPRRIRNCSLECLNNVVPMIADWFAPIPGMRQQIGEIRNVVSVGLMRAFLFILKSVFSCGGISVFDFIDTMSVDVAKNPVRSGRRGWEIWRLVEQMPTIPDSIRINIGSVLLCSLYIRNMRIHIRMNDIIFVTKLWSGDNIFRKIGRRINVRMIAIVLPMVVSFIAWFAFPSRRKWCPGRTDSAVSSEGAPRNIEGMKSRKV